MLDTNATPLVCLPCWTSQLSSLCEKPDLGVLPSTDCFTTSSRGLPGPFEQPTAPLPRTPLQPYAPCSPCASWAPHIHPRPRSLLLPLSITLPTLPTAACAAYAASEPAQPAQSAHLTRAGPSSPFALRPTNSSRSLPSRAGCLHTTRTHIDPSSFSTTRRTRSTPTRMGSCR